MSRAKLLYRLTVENLVPWYHKMLFHIRLPKAYHWKKYVLDLPIVKWEQKLSLKHGMDWLKEKGWFENSNRNFELFYEELMKLLKNQIVTETETEFLN